MAITRELAIGLSFADSTKRSLRFSSVSEDAEPQLKARIRAVKNATGNTGVTSTDAFDYKRYILSSDGATCTGIISATYTTTEKIAVYDAKTYEP